MMIQTLARETSFSPTQLQSLRSHIPGSVSVSQTTAPSLALFAPSFLSSWWSRRKPGAHPEFREKITRMFHLWTEVRSPPSPWGCCQPSNCPGGGGAAGSPRACCREVPAQHQASLAFPALRTNPHPQRRCRQPQRFSGAVFWEGCQSGQEWPEMA